MSNDFFPQRPASQPAIYAYEDTNPQYAGLLKVGYTTVGAKERVAQQYPTLRPGKLPYCIVWKSPLCGMTAVCSPTAMSTRCCGSTA